jgi:peptidoglycan/xylan/chitin deacetylase (PgdA/CDA1 family)
MYHRIRDKESLYCRSTVNFKKDLENLYALNFRPITYTEFVSKQFNIAPGASPVVITFDDSDPSQYRLLADGKVDPKCAVGIWQEFQKAHPDFEVKGVFFALPTHLFGNDQMAGIERCKELIKMGGEIGSHTLTHGWLSKMSDAQVTKEVTESKQFFEKNGIPCNTLAVPYGAYPKNRKLLGGYTSCAMAWGGAAPSCNDPKIKLGSIPRIEGSDRKMCLGWWLERFKIGTATPYVQP